MEQTERQGEAQNKSKIPGDRPGVGFMETTTGTRIIYNDPTVTEWGGVVYIHQVRRVALMNRESEVREMTLINPGERQSDVETCPNVICCPLTCVIIYSTEGEKTIHPSEQDCDPPQRTIWEAHSRHEKDLSHCGTAIKTQLLRKTTAQWHSVNALLTPQ